MIRGIGVDTASISETAYLLEQFGDTFSHKTFTPQELNAAHLTQKPAEYLAARFAAKEAVFKAVAPLLHNKSFDLRIVETLNAEDGHPVVQISPYLRSILKAAEVTTLHISITTEGDFATAFVIADA